MTSVNNIFNKIIEYAQNDFATESEKKELVTSIFNTLDTDQDKDLDNDDKINDLYKKYFGIEKSGKLTEKDLMQKIDDIAYNISFEEAPDSDYSDEYVTPEKRAELEKEQRVKDDLAYTDGYELYNMLDGPTSGTEYIDINIMLEDLKRLNKDNIMKFLEGFYSHGDSEGIIEFLDDEWEWGSAEISMNGKMNIIKSFLEHAKDKGFDNTIYYKRIERILDGYNSETDKNFNTWHILDWTTDNEIIDDAMKKLYNKIKEQEQN